MSNETKHTPGEWRADATDSNDGDEFDSWAVTAPADGYRTEVASAWSEADARLIAAAPEMLEALRNMLPVVERAFSRLPHADDCRAGSVLGARKQAPCTCVVGPARDQLIAAREALAKAEGRSNG